MSINLHLLKHQSKATLRDNYMVIVQLISLSYLSIFCDNERNGLWKLKTFADKQFIGWFFLLF